MFIDVDCRHPDAVLAPMPAGLSPQQVGGPGRCSGRACRLLSAHCPQLLATCLPGFPMGLSWSIS